MRKASYWLSFATGLVAVILTSPMIGNSQNREKFVISAKAGGVNAVTGRASVHGRGTSEWEQLTIKEDLKAGDVVRTGLDGRVEMLLNPGSYLRVGENSEFELADNSLENLEVRLLRGTAIVEATGADDTELLINISTPDTKLAIVRRGLYRVNVIPGDGTELIVRKGRVMLGDSHTKIKGGNKVVFNSGSASVAKLDKTEKKNFDTLDDWSKERGKTVAQANRKLRGRDLGFLLSGSADMWFSGLSPRASGFWFFNSKFGCYTFVPFYLGWGSPYGSPYSMAVYGPGSYYWNNGRLWGTNGNGRGSGSGGFGSGGGSGTGSGGGTGNGQAPQPRPAPAPISAPREIPSAAERKIERLNDRMPNP